MPRSKSSINQGVPEIVPKAQLRVTLTQTIKDVDRDHFKEHAEVASILDSHPGTKVKDVLGPGAKPKRIEVKYIERRKYNKQAKLDGTKALVRGTFVFA